MKDLRVKILVMATLIVSALGLAAPTLALNCATPASAKEQIQCGACDAAGTSGANCKPDSAGGSLTQTIRSVIQVLSLVIGAVAVVMVIIGGFRYITSAGNAESTKSARNTIVYAIVGLIIVALAQIIVHFVLNNVANGCVNGKTSSGQKCTP